MPIPCHPIAASTPREATPIRTSWNDAAGLSRRRVPLAGLLSLGVPLSHSLSQIMTIRAIPTPIALQPKVFSSLPVPLQLVSAPLSRAVLVPPGLSYKPVTSASHDCGNLSHDPTHDSSRDPSVTCTSHDLSAHDPGNIRPCDPGKIPHDLSRNWSSTMSPDQTRFGCVSNPLINTWQIVGTINQTHPLNNQWIRNATQSMKM